MNPCCIATVRNQDGKSSIFWAVIAAIVLVAVMMLSVGLFIIWPSAPGVTATVDMFTLVQENTLAGLTALDLGISLSNLVSILLYLALYVVLGA